MRGSTCGGTGLRLRGIYTSGTSHAYYEDGNWILSGYFLVTYIRPENGGFTIIGMRAISPDDLDRLLARIDPGHSPSATVTPTTPSPSSSVPAAQGFAGTYTTVESGVVRILATTCEGDGIGTGFLLSPRVVATAAHVIDGAQAVSVDGPNGVQPAEVIGIDTANNLALLRLQSAVNGHTFTFASSDPSPGTSVAAIGFPLNEPKTLTVGTVSGLDRTVPVDGQRRSGLLQTDTAINPGNSGGPLINLEGEVAGVVDALMRHSQGIGYAVEASVAGPALQEGDGMTAPPPPGCTISKAPTQLTVTPRLRVPLDADSVRVQETLSNYYNAINDSEYDLVMQQFAPSFAANFTAEELARTLATSIDYDVVVHSVTTSANGARAWVTFVSIQAHRFGPEGESCTQWSLDYGFVRSGDRLLIDNVRTHIGDGHAPC